MKTSVWALIALSMVLGLFTGVAMHRTGVPDVGFAVFLITSAGWLVIIASGALAQKMLAASIDDAEFTFALAAGIVLSSMAVLVLAEIFQITAAVSLVVFGIVVALLMFGCRRNFTLAFSGTGSHLFVVPCCAIFVLVWCWGSMTSLGAMPKTGILSLWMDIFIHAVTLLQYGEFRTLGQGSFEFAGAARPFYHYGSFVLPAAILPVLDVSGLQVAVGLHLPVGLLAMFAGTHALAKRISGAPLVRMSAFVAVSLLFILPDPSTYGLANGWFGIRWILMSHPGSGYAIAAVLISLVFVKTWLDLHNPVALVGMVIFTAAVFQLRAHMLLWYLPAMVALLAIVQSRYAQTICKQPLTWLIVLALVLAFANVNHYLWFVHLGSEPTEYTGVYANLVGVFGAYLAAPIGFLLLYPGMLGGLVILYPLLLFANRKLGKLHALDWFPLVLACIAGIIIILAPTSPNGDPFEFKHRAFVLLYVVTLVWTCKIGMFVVSNALPGRSVYILVCTLMTALGVMAYWNSKEFFNADKPKFDWGKQYVDTSTSVDLIAVADFVRHHGRQANTVLVLPIDLKARAADQATRFASISNAPLYVSRYTMWDRSKANDALINAANLANAQTFETAIEQAKKMGVHWLVINSRVGPNFDPEFRRVAFRQGNWAVFSFGP